MQARQVCTAGGTVRVLREVCVVIAAIERAMAYIDTGELPWDMDLCLDHKSEVSVHIH